MLESLILTCVLSSPISLDKVDQYFSCKDRNEIIMHMQEYIPLFSEYFEHDDIETALRITYCESRGNPNAVNKNKDNSYDKGLWQFNDHTWNWLKDKLKIKQDRFDIETSTAVASWLIYNDTINHWWPSAFCWKINLKTYTRFELERFLD